MSKETKIQKEVVKTKLKKKAKIPKFKLISYTIKATIPTGQYANIQPEVTVQAESIEAAERAVMPYIETLFARYRDGGVKPVEPTQVRPVNPVLPPQHTSNDKVNVVTPTPAIVLTVPFTRAKTALESCTSIEAYNLVLNQIRISTKLIDSEKADLEKLAEIKLVSLNGNKA